ncbi:hypothetical protein SAY87_001211 [Trapa incisa]|uniref:DUF3700 domain-containing protein n=1 Tax=Trapa incisa TaxID=236973 RepID=A0AAN7GCV5_9MYRT|nr:hypothetical protein SAY87_001211 [Trapa incisa]
MLAVFDKSVGKAPDALHSPHTKSVGCLCDHFASVHPGAITVNLGPSGRLAYSLDRQNPLHPRYPLTSSTALLFFLLFFSSLSASFPPRSVLQISYGLNKTANEVIIVIEAYRTLRDRGPYPGDQVVRDLNGKFAFILYDNSAKMTFVAADADRSVPFYWGSDSEGNLVFSDDVEAVKKGCGKSFAPFPKGCFFTTCGGLRSYEHPFNELKPVPRVDSSGQVCGANFKVDSESKKESSGMPRVGSAANWSSHY